MKDCSESGSYHSMDADHYKLEAYQDCDSKIGSLHEVSLLPWMGYVDRRP